MVAKASKEAASKAARALSQLGASKGGKARAATLSPEQRSEIASAAAKARWKTPADQIADAPLTKTSYSSRPRSTWRGELSADMFATGVLWCELNAQHLVTDALLLLERARFASATALAQFAIEEAAKPRLLLKIFLSPTDPAERKRAWRDFENHRVKAGAHWEKVLRATELPADIRDRIDSADAGGDLGSFVRETALYVDCVQGPAWIVPCVHIREDLARSSVQAAVAVLRMQRSDLSRLPAGLRGVLHTSDRSRLRAVVKLEEWLRSDKGTHLIQSNAEGCDTWDRTVAERLHKYETRGVGKPADSQKHETKERLK